MPSTVGIVAGSRDEFTPLAYSPLRWYDCSDPTTFRYSSATGSFVGPDGFYMNGVNNTLNNAVINNTNGAIGNFDVVCQLALDNWSAADQPIIESGSYAYFQAAWTIRVESNVLRVAGADIGNIARSLPTWVNGTRHWVRVKRNQSTGVITFYASDDGITWSQLGAPHSGYVGALTSNYLGLPTVGRAISYYGYSLGTVQRVQIWNGGLDEGGTKVVDVDFTAPWSTFTNRVFDSVSGTALSINSTTSVAGASGALVRQVDDKSGNGRHAVQTEGNWSYMPHVAGSETGWLPSLYFDGNDHLFENTDISSPIHTFLVARRTSDEGFFYDKEPDGITTGRLYLYAPAGFAGARLDTNFGNGIIGDKGFRTLFEIREGAYAELKARTESFSRTTTTSTSMRGLTLMSRYSVSAAADFMTGYLCEFIQFADLNEKQTQIVRDYLRRKWSVAG